MIFFGTGTGRCGTMLLANLISTEADTICLHEGFVRRREVKGEQWLPGLTLQNLAAYHDPLQRLPLFQQTRSSMASIAKQHKVSILGDIAYNYAPFTSVIPEVFPDARLLVMFRDGRDFVRSVYTKEIPDPLPVGWLDPERPETPVERFIALGRLRPHQDDHLDLEWPHLTPLEQNAWLWSETNRLILEGIEAWPKERVLTLRFEDFFRDVIEAYKVVRRFLGLDGEISDLVKGLVDQPINRRPRSAYILPAPSCWSAEKNTLFMRFAGDMMCRLGYQID